MDRLPTFNDFMDEKFAKRFPEVLDDELPDKYNEWIADLDQYDWLGYATECVDELNRRLSAAIEAIDLGKKSTEIATKIAEEAVEELEKIRAMAIK